MACGGPDERGVYAVGIVSVGVAPGVDEVWVGVGGATDHRRFWLEVAFGGWGAVVLVRAEEIGEESLARSGVVGWINNRGGCRGIRRVKIVVGEVAIAGGLEGCDFGFGGGGGAVTSNSSRRPQGKACEDADDGDDSEEFDEGEGRRRAARG